MHETGEGNRLIVLQINGREYRLKAQPRVTLLDALRDYLHLTGTKKGCDHGVCGACTILIDGERRISCLTLAVMQEGHTIETIEGVADDHVLHALQTAFIRHDAFQCGYCTPGQIMSSLGLLHEGEVRSEREISEHMENQCRCGCYTNIVAAIGEVWRDAGEAAK